MPPGPQIDLQANSRRLQALRPGLLAGLVALLVPLPAWAQEEQAAPGLAGPDDFQEKVREEVRETEREQDEPETLRIDVRHDDQLTAVRVDGEIDRDTADRLRRRLHAALSLATPGRLAVELTGVPFVDAAGAGVLREVLLCGRVSGVDVTITGARPHVVTVLSVLGLPG